MNAQLIRSRLAPRLLAYLVLGFVASIGVAWALSATVDVTLGRMQTSQSYSTATETRWSLTRWTRAGSMAAVSTRAADRAWGSRQAAGPPDTSGFGDIVTAWASSSRDGQREWLELTYDRAVTPAEVHIYETYNPGAIDRVTAFDEAGREVDAWAGQDPLVAALNAQSALTSQPVAGGGVAKIPLRAGFPTRRIKVYIDSPSVQGWNEIDAVGLVDRAGGVQWATGVKASSVYGTAPSSTATTPAPADLVPRWGGLATPGADLVAGRAKTETRAVAAYGWPMLAFWDERDAGATQNQAAAATTTAPPVPGGPVSFVAVRAYGSPRGATPVAPTAAPTAPPPRTPMPMRPIWRGLLVNTLVFAAAIAALHWLAIWPIRLSREVSRVRAGRCVECGYDLGYDYLNGCPECGWRRAEEERTSSAPSSQRPALQSVRTS